MWDRGTQFSGHLQLERWNLVPQGAKRGLHSESWVSWTSPKAGAKLQSVEV